MTHSPLNILLVEDDDVDVINVQRAFQKASIVSPIFRATDGIHALELLRTGVIPIKRRLVLLDLNMPRMSGIEFLHEIRRDDALRSTPVVVLTTSDDAADRLHAHDLHVAGYLLKPVAFGRFVELMILFHEYWSHMEFP